ncbi:MULTISPECIES: DNA-binding domain-containing protein [unclassified Dyella]|uniref:HvfC/BufC N-terminal domain-containing protein n=1 Tax=unclassified Dyella TaxID=2634549 RepID=UPI002032F009|nr:MULTISPECIES: DNA-binding domain-containing protein [unclassified Dyella]
MLAEMQRDFSDWLVQAGDDDGLRRGLIATRGLAAYQNNYRTQLVNVLRASYPQLKLAMGDEAFLQLAIHYIDRQPPSSWTLDAYGADLPDSLHALYPHNPDLQELAWIEWTLSEVFVAADAAALSPADLDGVDWETATLRLSPGLRHRAATTNAMAIWSALQDETPAPEAEMLEAPAGLVAWRQDFMSRLRQVDAIEHAALLSVQEDGHFGALCDALIERLGEEPGIARAGQLLADWIGSGIVVGVSH